MAKVFNIGDIVEMKKTHPCGSKEWKIIRMGADIKIKCCGCSRIIMLERSKFEKDMKKVIKTGEELENNK
ncbi:hypothetical protein CLLI_03650 [Clostridium liquoris]|jgi:hypothetical protein|uniref:DUF951 domain-containing protein n=1 Tax=Clostridium liquoris TaxID=1289519 RepID=A0A2T0B8W8_9CLOT|nr:DUF951 domain-containing protein [Clostridium liquoris]PRR80338.1 hypothetical protein CLLI_03650 [Clostridium liquoris]